MENEQKTGDMRMKELVVLLNDASRQYYAGEEIPPHAAA